MEATERVNTRSCQCIYTFAKHKHHRDSCKHAAYKYAYRVSPIQAAHSGLGFRIQDSGLDWRTGNLGDRCRSHGAMSECVSSDAFTFIAFVNYSHKDIKCKLWNRRHTRAAQHTRGHQSSAELRYNIRWMLHVYIGELLNSFCIWLSHAKPNRIARFGLRSLNAQDRFAPPEIRSIVGKAIWPLDWLLI